MLGFRKGLVLWDRSLTAFRLVPPVRDYVTGQALGKLNAAIRGGQARDVVPQQQEYLAETWRMGSLHGHWASSVRISGTAVQRGQTLRLSLGLTRSGKVSGQIGVGGADVTVLITGGYAYVRLNAAYLRLRHAPSSVCKLVCGKYLKTSARAAGLAGLSMRGFLAPVTRGLPGAQARAASFGGTIVFGGEPVWVLQPRHGTVLRQGMALVAARGRPYLLEVWQPGQGTLHFTQWNAVRIPGPPPPSQVLTIGQLSALPA